MDMDLHDFADVAANYDFYLPEIVKGTYYLDNFEEFHLSLAEQYGDGGILDIGCGTGALTIPLTKAGYDVTALDLSSPMVEITKEKLALENRKASLLCANMLDFKLDRTCSLAIIARSGFMHLLTASAQRQALLNIRAHLSAEGILTLNHFQPHPMIQASQMQSNPDAFRFRAEYVNIDGKRERISEAHTYDYMTQIMRGNWKFETLDDGGNVIATRIRPQAMRHTYRQEMAYLFELCGFRILDVFQNYRFEKAKDNLIWVVEKA